MLTYEQFHNQELLVFVPYNYVGDYSRDDDDYQFWAINLELEREIERFCLQYGYDVELWGGYRGAQVIAIYKNNTRVCYLSIFVDDEEAQVYTYKNNEKLSRMFLPLLKNNLYNFEFKNYMRDVYQKEINAY